MAQLADYLTNTDEALGSIPSTALKEALWCMPSPQEAEAGDPGVQGQSSTHNKFRVSLDYSVSKKKKT